MNKNTLVKASVSVPVTEQDEFEKNKNKVMEDLEKLGSPMSFSKFIRVVMKNFSVEKRGEKRYIVIEF